LLCESIVGEREVEAAEAAEAAEAGAAIGIAWEGAAIGWRILL